VDRHKVLTIQEQELQAQILATVVAITVQLVVATVVILMGLVAIIYQEDLVVRMVAQVELQERKDLVEVAVALNLVLLLEVLEVLAK
tara:strand:+ start:49 stop:309 length:261 start_codon:yes stop_codon:yes gene_type:complete